ncbi:MAG TPA: hypothetical protein VGR09_10925 [Gemmatimonadales bacterium]|nr:hypothetical protein [Gemmatimonadales bacterium]
MRRSLVVSLALLAIVRSPAVAQTCMGLASFSTAPMQVTGNGMFSSGVNSFGAAVGYGMQSGLWGNLGVQTLSIDGASSHPLNIGAHAGYETAVGKSRNPIHVCPNASFSIGNGPDDVNFNSSTQDATLGVNFGTVLSGSNPRMKIVPTAGISWAHTKLSAKDSVGTSLGSASDSYGLAQLGIGLVMNQNISIRPSVDIPLGLTGSNARFGMTLGYNFGSKGAPAPRRR